jgi:hypothetical protein
MVPAWLPKLRHPSTYPTRADRTVTSEAPIGRANRTLPKGLWAGDLQRPSPAHGDADRGRPNPISAVGRIATGGTQTRPHDYRSGTVR